MVKTLPVRSIIDAVAGAAAPAWSDARSRAAAACSRCCRRPYRLLAAGRRVCVRSAFSSADRRRYRCGYRRRVRFLGRPGRFRAPRHSLGDARPADGPSLRHLEPHDDRRCNRSGDFRSLRQMRGPRQRPRRSSRLSAFFATLTKMHAELGDAVAARPWRTAKAGSAAASSSASESAARDASAFAGSAPDPVRSRPLPRAPRARPRRSRSSGPRPGSAGSLGAGRAAERRQAGARAGPGRDWRPSPQAARGRRGRRVRRAGARWRRGRRCWPRPCRRARRSGPAVRGPARQSRR